MSPKLCFLSKIIVHNIILTSFYCSIVYLSVALRFYCWRCSPERSPLMICLQMEQIFVKRAYPHRVMEIVDKRLLEVGGTNMGLERLNEMQPCLVAILGIGLSCSLQSPKETMDMRVVLKNLQDIKNKFLKFDAKEREDYYANSTAAQILYLLLRTPLYKHVHLSLSLSLSKSLDLSSNVIEGHPIRNRKPCELGTLGFDSQHLTWEYSCSNWMTAALKTLGFVMEYFVLVESHRVWESALVL
ncbi:hypothetical protein AMTRI_Chr08g159710 [Amborella trichopoda]